MPCAEAVAGSSCAAPCLLLRPNPYGTVSVVPLSVLVIQGVSITLPAHAGLRDERDLSIVARLACGAAAGSMGQTVAYPFDVARRRLQVGPADISTHLEGGRGPHVLQLRAAQLHCCMAAASLIEWCWRTVNTWLSG